MALAPSRPRNSRRGFLAGLVPLGLAASAGFAPAAQAALPPEKALSLHHRHTGETVRAVYFADGRYVEDGLAAINRLLRDWRTGEVMDYDPKVLDLLHALVTRLEVRGPIEVFSGYRSPETNAALRRRSPEVAKNSLHMFGKAIDLDFPGSRLAELHRAAMALGAGGVGYYPRAGFVHLDTGPVRHWGEGGGGSSGRVSRLSNRARARAARLAAHRKKAPR